jgi:hypothetical protein
VCVLYHMMRLTYTLRAVHTIYTQHTGLMGARVDEGVAGDAQGEEQIGGRSDGRAIHRYVRGL